MSDAQWSRTTYRDQTRAQADARQSQRWTDQDVDYAMGLVHMREWKRLLNAAPYLRSATITATQDANGQIATSALDSGSGDALKRLYRVLDVAQGTRMYDETSFRDVPIATSATTAQTGWYRLGDYVQCLPVESGASMTLWVNHTPTPMDRLSSDSAFAEFPRDYELLIPYEAAAWLLVKAGSESDSAATLQQMAEQIRQDMLGDIARASVNPKQMRYPDSARDWAGG